MSKGDFTMSVKTMSLVLEMECPTEINGLPFRSSTKFVLAMYADHADHNGRNIFPAILTIARKTGLDERTVQRLTRQLEEMGALVADGQGPKGQNRWYIPGAGGGVVSPVTFERGDIPSGDIPSGDIPSGDMVPPDIKDSPLDLQYVNNIEFGVVWETLKRELQKELTGSQFTKWVEPTKAVAFDGKILTVEIPDSYTSDWLTARIAKQAQSKLAGILNQTISLKFVVPETVQ